jgi:UDP-3-O-[3-hydroxymyristoyl] glucosamine N-acyltransferase
MHSRTLHELAALCGADLRGDGSCVVVGAARLDEARPDQVSFLTQPKYREYLATTKAAAVIVGRDVTVDRTDLALLVCADPEAALNEVVVAFAPKVPSQPIGVHPTAVVDPSAQLGVGVSIGPFCVVGPDVVIGEGTLLHPRVTLGAGVVIGPRGALYPGVVVYPHSVLGADCVVHAGTVIGSDGFGFRHTPAGWVKTPQVGNVEIGDRVEIGANCSIDCGRFGPTRIGSGTKLDNQVHVGHNVDVGEDCLLIAQVGIGGSTRLGRGVILAGRVGLAGHLEIGAGARIGAGSGVITDVPGGSDWFGYPAKPRLHAMRISKEEDRLPELRRRVRELERRAGIETERDGRGGGA